MMTLLVFLELLSIGVLTTVKVSAGGSCSSAKLCCDGRNSGCVIQKASPNAIIESPQDKPCYCDHACLRLNDCCTDFRDTCRVVDCDVSEWEEWLPCGGRCGAGIQTRTRSIVEPTANGGKHCPQLEQSRACHSFTGCSPDSWGFHLTGVPLLMLENMENSASSNEITYDGYCSTLTILRVSRACGKHFPALTKGTEICAICRSDLEAVRCPSGLDQPKIRRGRILTRTSARCRVEWTSGGNNDSQCASSASCREAARRFVFV